VIRSDLAADVLALIRGCLGPGCEYELFRSRGIPPAECKSIAVTWAESQPTYDADCDQFQPCEVRQRSVMRIILTRCCVTADAGMMFNSAAEDDASICLWRDTELIERCLACADLRQIAIDHGLNSFRHVATRFDVETLGGCNSAYIEVMVESEECCP